MPRSKKPITTENEVKIEPKPEKKNKKASLGLKAKFSTLAIEDIKQNSINFVDQSQHRAIDDIINNHQLDQNEIIAHKRHKITYIAAWLFILVLLIVTIGIIVGYILTNDIRLW
ncbi:hypothetical protein ACJA23_01910 [Mycoplasma corogypsi]|uniref:hypothetical protein n=1 Tax=Mycoplasma corogypsi TaxID=2106 RepID=UPI003872E2BD